MSLFARTPEPPYWAVIFTSIRTGLDTDLHTDKDAGYAETAARLMELAGEQPGFLGAESARDGLGITVSYWKDEASIAAWRRNAEHAAARRHGRDAWYSAFRLRVARVERDASFGSG
ncbi:MAG: antibiotic biosynthesis monooxygenase [Desulfovibrionaceae bacterium]